MGRPLNKEGIMNVLEGIVAVSKVYESLSEDARTALGALLRGELREISECEPIDLHALAAVDDFLDAAYNNIGEAVDEVIEVRERLDDFVGWFSTDTVSEAHLAHDPNP